MNTNQPEIDNLKELYIILFVIDCSPVVIKCPIVGETSRYITIKVKERKKDFDKTTESGEHSTVTSDFLKEIKINKKDLNCNFKFRASTSYEQALSFLLLHQRRQILDKLKAADNQELWLAFIEECKKDFVSALKLAAESLGMSYLFKLEDDTTIAADS